MKKTTLIAISVLIFLALIFAIFKTYESITINKSIKLSMHYIANNTDENGRFVYITNVNPKISSSRSIYNTTIHADILYVMYLCEKYLNNTSLKEKRYLASEYLIKNYIQQLSSDMYAVVSKAKEEHLQSPSAKLGSNGLALCGLSNLYSNGKIDLATLQGLGNFIIYMQKNDGSFYTQYNIENKTKTDKLASLYSPSEAALGLLCLNEVNPDEKWVKASSNALLYLTNRKNNFFDYYAILATKKLFETPENGLNDQDKKVLKTTVEKMTMNVLKKQITDRKSPYRGSLDKTNRLGNVANIVEGLSAAYSVTDDKELKKEIRHALKLGTDFLSRYQVKEGERKGGIPVDVSWVSPEASPKAQVIRINNVGRALSAWILYKQTGWFK